MISLDNVTEAAGRWLAARTTRRSFLGNVGRISLAAAGGALIASTLEQRAEARVCGQSGKSPKCPTYDCFAPGIWGWCWYAGDASCCADGGLKKICDCCQVGYPNVHGYCPDGANVYCVVESCLEDPRVMNVGVDRYPGKTSVEVSLQRVAAFAAGSTPTVVLADGEDAFTAAIALPVAAVAKAIVVVAPRDEVSAPLATELTRLGVKRIIVVGPSFSPSMIASLSSVTTDVTQIGTNPSISLASVEVARWIFNETKIPAAVCVSASNAGSLTALAAGSYASISRIPLLVAAEAGVALRRETSATITWLGDELASLRSGNDVTVAGADPVSIAKAMVEARLAAEPQAAFPLAMYPIDLPAVATALMQPGVLSIPHLADNLDPTTRDWLMARRARFLRAHIATGVAPSFQERRIWELQSALNGFQAQLLIGGDGQGLPVITQPNEERPAGKARLAGIPSTTTPPPVIGRSKPKKRPPTTIK